MPKEVNIFDLGYIDGKQENLEFRSLHEPSKSVTLLIDLTVLLGFLKWLDLLLPIAMHFCFSLVVRLMFCSFQQSALSPYRSNSCFLDSLHIFFPSIFYQHRQTVLLLS